MKKELLAICKKTLIDNAERQEGPFMSISNTGIPADSKFHGKYILDWDALGEFAAKHGLTKGGAITTFDEEKIETACDCKLDNHNEYENDVENVDLYDAYEIIFN